MRIDVAPYDLLRAIGDLATSGGEDGDAYTGRLVELLISRLLQAG